MANKGKAFFEWDINNIALQSGSWVCSPRQFTLKGGDQVEFSVELQAKISEPDTYNKLNVRIKKDDCRSASATIEVNLITSNPGFLPYEDRSGKPFTSSGYPCLIYLPGGNPIVRKRIDNWKTTYVFEDILTIVLQNNLTALVRDICYIKNTIVRCNITWHGFDELPGTEQVNLRENLETQLEFHHFFKSNEFHDVTLVVGNKKLPAHKIILSRRSPFFYKMLTTDMKESRENCIKINNFTVETITEMLEFFYTNKTKASNDVGVALRMIGLAEIYQISDLKEICKATLLKNIAIDNVLNILYASLNSNATELRKHSIDFMVHNRSKIVDVEEFENFYETQPLLAHEFLVAVCKKV